MKYKKTRSASSSKRSASSSGRSTSTSFLRKTQESLFEVLIGINSTKGFFLEPVFYLVMEVVALLLMLVFQMKDFFLWDDVVSQNHSIWVRYLFIIVDPAFAKMDLVAYTIMFITACCFASLCFCIFLYVIYTKTTSELLMTLVGILARSTRTVFMYPFLSILLSPCRCYFLDGSFTAHMYDTQKCFNFPFLFYVIIGLILSLFLLVVGTCDCLFLLAKYRPNGIGYCTASPDGRFILMIYLLQVFGVVFRIIAAPQGVDFLGVILNTILFATTIVILLAVIRFVPWFQCKYVFFIATMLTVYATFSLISLTTYATKSYFPILILLSLLGSLPLVWTFLILRYFLLLIFFRKRIRSNFFLCYFSVDIVIGIYVTQSFKRIFNWSRFPRRRKIVGVNSTGGTMASTTSTEMIKIIQTLLEDEDFDKTKTLCSHLLSLSVEKYPLLAKAILNHTHTIMQSSVADIELSLEFYRLKITNMQESGDTGRGSSQSRKNRAKMLSELNRARRREETLSRLIQMLMHELSREDRKVSFANFPQILSTIQSNMEFCEAVYGRVVKIYPCPTTYRRYANYLMAYSGDRSSASLYLKEANQLEFNNERENSSAISGYTEQRYNRDRQKTEATSSPLPVHHSDFETSDCRRSEEEEETDEEETEVEEEMEGEEETSACSEAVVVEEEEEEAVESSSSSDSERRRRRDEDDLMMKSPSMNMDIIKGEEEFGNSTTQLQEGGNASVRGGPKTNASVASTMMGAGGEQSHVAKKVTSSRYFSAYLLRCYCCMVLLYVVGGIIAIFTLSLVLSTGFSKSAELIEVASKTSKSVSEVFHLMRKLQVSYYSEIETPLPYERNSTAFRIILEEHCEKVLSRVRWLYAEMSDSQTESFHEIHLELSSQLEEKNEVLTLNTYETADYSLVDAIQIYGDMCHQIVSMDEFRWGGNETIDEEYGRIQDELFFFFIRLNEPLIVQGMEDLSEILIGTEADTAINYMIIYIAIPSVGVFVLFLNCLVYVCFTCQQRKGFRGFMLIPSEEVQRLISRYGRMSYGNDDHKSKIIGSTTSGGSSEIGDVGRRSTKEVTGSMSESGGSSGISSSHVRVETVRFSLIQQFFFYSCLSILVALLVFSMFTLVGCLTCSLFSVRNREYDYILHLEGEETRIHLWITEVLYRNDSLFTQEQVVENAEREANSLASTYRKLRFGDEELGLPGNDNEKTAYDIYYRECDDDYKEEMTRFEELKCHSMNDKVNYVTNSANQIIKSLGSENLTTLRASKDYQDIIMIDNFSNGSIFDEGAIMQNFEDLREYTKNKVNVYLSYLNNFSLLLLILFLPFFGISYILLFRSFASRLNRNLTMPRLMMLLMKKEVLMSKNIYEYVTGKSTSSFRKLFEREKTNRMETMFDILEMASYGFVCFDSNFKIFHYNSTSDELFRIKASDAKNLGSIFNKESMKTIQSWMRRNLMTSFNGELVAIYEEQEYPVLADISRSPRQKNLYIGVFENMESTKKKDLLKESERRTEQIEILMRNILPVEIAKVAKLEDFEFGNCKVYQHKRATAYFADICDFTGMSQKTNPETIISMLHKFYCNIDVLCEYHKLEKIKTIGDCYFCVSGIPTYKPLHAVSAMDFAIDVLKMMRVFNKKENPLKDDFPLQVRTGLASGKLVAGIIGRTKRCYDIWGAMINEAARMETNGFPGKIQISRSTYESIFDRYKFLEREIHLQGIGNVLAYTHTPDLEDVSKVMKILNEADELFKKNYSNNKSDAEKEDGNVQGGGNHPRDCTDDGDDDENSFVSSVLVMDQGPNRNNVRGINGSQEEEVPILTSNCTNGGGGGQEDDNNNNSFTKKKEEEELNGEDDVSNNMVVYDTTTIEEEETVEEEKTILMRSVLVPSSSTTTITTDENYERRIIHPPKDDDEEEAEEEEMRDRIEESHVVQVRSPPSPIEVKKEKVKREEDERLEEV